ncbi:MAG: isoprenylcysteine carboxylmethyltransferase family protein [Ignavibacteriae bacterium]|nr:isoprenylcysteine carboxylmethyltransferase family protein [Ignavibacteriota bacterium]MCB9210129.1 isoprenylcysteine carboxylmethyltransferase family protein [Ignavibacteriales bacterium]MCB9259508.1 isoprenylcysteine carboxylmethyltransferase family protein [Ignavibacteriales bacterium]
MKELAKILFKFRSYTPVPFVILMLVFYNGNLLSWIIGLIILILGELLRFWGVSFAGSITRTTSSVKADQLVTAGPFAHVRNPLYVGNILIYLGFGIISLALFPYLQIIALVWFVFQYTLIVSIEEEFLESKFGQSYKDYKANVNRIVPKLKAYKPENAGVIEPNYQKGLKSEMRTMQALGVILLLTIIIHLVK